MCYIKSIIVYIFVVYVPPTTNIDTFNKFFKAFEELDYLYNNKVVMLGDFNVPHFLENDKSYNKTSAIQNLLTFFNLQKFNNILNSSGRILDLVFSNLECEIIRESPPMCLKIPTTLYF